MRGTISRISGILIFSLLLLVAVTSASRRAASAGEETQEERIDRINREIAEKGEDWVAGKTTVGSLPYDERQRLNGFIPPTAEEWAKMPKAAIEVSADLPESFDWRDHEGVTPAKDQRSCGSCWAFAAIGQLEAHARIIDRHIVDLSEQAALDCDPWGGGCDGGWIAGALNLFITDGAVGELCLPYLAYVRYPCTMSSCEVLASIDTFGYLDRDSEIKQAVYDYGPISCGMFAHDFFHNYISGCYAGDYADLPNHAVLIVGWDDNMCGGAGAWIIKNSWGEDWGMNGFGYVKYGVCSIGISACLIDYHESDILVHLDVPNGGEAVYMGEDFEILWTTGRQTPDSISVYLSLDSGVSFDSTIVSGLPGTSESYLWTVPELPVPTARVKVVAFYNGAAGGWDDSDADFTIVGAPYRYVSPTGADVYPYTLPRWAATSIQTAVSAANPGDSILVQGNAIYKESVNVSTAVVLLGGWNGDFSERDPVSNVTTISGFGSAVSFMNTYAMYCGINGFTIIKGDGRDAQLPLTGSYGGGIFCFRASPVIRNNIIRECGYAGVSGFSGGGGICCHDGTVVIENNVIEDNSSQCGGGIYAYQATVTIRNNRIAGSMPNAEYSGTKNGGGIYALHSELTLENNLIENNTGYRYGGGIFGGFSAITISADTISSNAALVSGAGIFTERSPLDVAGAVIVENVSAGHGGGIYHRWDRFDITNSIIALNDAAYVGGGVYTDSVWGSFENNTIDRNTAFYAGGNLFFGSMESSQVKNNLVTYGIQYGFMATDMSKMTVQYNDFYGNFPEETFLVTIDSTNTCRNPHYADTTSMDYRLALHSGAIDTGDPAGSFDPDGSQADMGAYGGPGAAFAAPGFVTGLAAAASCDTTIHIGWTESPSPGIDYYAIYAAAQDGFLPDEANWIGSVAAGVTSFDDHPVSGCAYYRVSAVNLSGYAGGYSNQAGACTAGADTIPPSVTVIHPNGGEFFETGDTVYVQWVATDGIGIDSVSIWFSETGGAAYGLIAGGEPNDSIYTWIAPVAISDSCLIMVKAYDTSLNEGADTSDGVFSVKDLTDIDDDGDDPVPPTVYISALEQNYPNPFNGLTTIVYTIGDRCAVELGIFDPAGRLVRTIGQGERAQGRYSTTWNGKDNSGRAVSSGVYFCRIKAGKFQQTRKIIYMR